MIHHIKPVDSLTIHDISALAKDAVDRNMTLEEANTYPGHIGAAFEAAYRIHAEASCAN